MNSFILDGAFIYGWQIWITRRLEGGDVVDDTTLRADARSFFAAFEDRHFDMALERLVRDGRVVRGEDGYRKGIPTPVPLVTEDPEPPQG
jgi:hypothetical protein